MDNDIEIEEAPTEEAQALLTRLADRLEKEEAEVEAIKEQLHAAEEKARATRETDIPELMLSMGLKECKTASGISIKVKEEVRVSFFAKDKLKREPAFAWLDAKGHKGLVKNNVTVALSREQEKQANELYEELKSKGLNVKCEKDIHSSTLKAFLSELLREGEDVPLPLFGAFVQKFAKISR